MENFPDPDQRGPEELKDAGGISGQRQGLPEGVDIGAYAACMLLLKNPLAAPLCRRMAVAASTVAARRGAPPLVAIG